MKQSFTGILHRMDSIFKNTNNKKVEEQTPITAATTSIINNDNNIDTLVIRRPQVWAPCGLCAFIFSGVSRISFFQYVDTTP